MTTMEKMKKKDKKKLRQSQINVQAAGEGRPRMCSYKEGREKKAIGSCTRSAWTGGAVLLFCFVSSL